MTTARGAVGPAAPDMRSVGADRPGRYDVERIKREHPLLDTVVAHGVRLRRIGDATWQGRCPLPGHDDRTPSFTVYGRDGRFKCFGGSCGECGDVIDFVRLMRGLPNFQAACAYLSGAAAAPPAGGPQPRTGAGERPCPPRRWDALTLPEQEVMNEVAAHYQQLLWKTPAALAYLRRRGIDDGVLERCGVGFVPGGTLAAALPTGRRQLARELGLLHRTAGGGAAGTWRETMAGRIVVPELRGGNCIWLIGRALPGTPAAGPGGKKYQALRGERPVLGLAHVAGQPASVLCEGVLDWLIAIGWDLPAWSPCGTQLPPARLGFLAPTRIIFGVFDADDSGRAAARRFATLLGPRFRPIALPEGLDLNDLARRPGGRALFMNLLDAAWRGHDRHNAADTGACPD